MFYLCLISLDTFAMDGMILRPSLDMICSSRSSENTLHMGKRGAVSYMPQNLGHIRAFRSEVVARCSVLPRRQDQSAGSPGLDSPLGGVSSTGDATPGRFGGASPSRWGGASPGSFTRISSLFSACLGGPFVFH